MVTYHNYQQILDFQAQGEQQVLKQRRARRKFKKSLDGCLCCKKRRKKCDEVKPVCKGCLRNGLRCEWPKHVVVVVKTAVGDDVDADADADKDQIKEERGDSLVSDRSSDHEFLLLDQFLNIQLENKIGSPVSTADFDLNFDLPFPDSLETSPKPINQNHSIPGIELSYEDQLCYNQFINKFIPSLTASHCENEQFSPLKLFPPFASTHQLARDVFLACGATMLCFDSDEFHQLAHDKYVHSVNLLIQNLKDSPRACEDHLFVCVQMLQTLCLRDKNIGLNATKSASHLSAAYEILRKRKREIQGLSVLDRVLTEHFLLNYPITIMLCHHDKLSSKAVPSPFEFFDEFNEFLTTPIMNNNMDDPWNNHPIMGICQKASELSAKSTWICRLLQHPISQDTYSTSLDLKTKAFQELEFLSNYETTDKWKLVNISFAKSMLYGCLIITKKICQWDINLFELQDDVNNMIKEFKICYKHFDPKDVLIPIWGLFVCGSASTTMEQREFLTYAFVKIASKINSSLTLKVLKYLKIIWDEGNGDSQHVGFEFLFDTTVLDIVCS